MHTSYYVNWIVYEGSSRSISCTTSWKMNWGITLSRLKGEKREGNTYEMVLYNIIWNKICYPCTMCYITSVCVCVEGAGRFRLWRDVNKSCLLFEEGSNNMLILSRPFHSEWNFVKVFTAQRDLNLMYKWRWRIRN